MTLPSGSELRLKTIDDSRLNVGHVKRLVRADVYKFPTNNDTREFSFFDW